MSSINPVIYNDSADPVKRPSVASVSAKAPAKLILSGEHAVVYGYPSIAIAVDLYATTTVSQSHCKNNILGFDFANLKYNAKHTIGALTKLKDKAYFDYQRFLRGECSIREVLNKPFELLQFTVSHFLDRLDVSLPGGIDIKTNSNIPSGCGMGSSAATIMSLLYAVGHLLNLDMSKEHYIELGREAENLQHGKSSGLDLHLTALGGCIKFKAGQYSKLNIKTNNFYIINTGRPAATTGQCVSSVKKYFTHNEHVNNFGENFANLTTQLERELLSNNIAEIVLILRENHKLLNYIGVVPERVNNFISEMQNFGAAAKVCGAGSIAGEAAGAVLGICPDPEIVQAVQNLTKQYGYTMHSVSVDSHGIRIL